MQAFVRREYTVPNNHNIATFVNIITHEIFGEF